MNFGTLNAQTLNGGVTDPIVRTSVLGVCYASASTRARALIYGKGVSQPEARVAGVVVRLNAKSALGAAARAAQSVIPRRFVLAVCAVSGVAQAQVGIHTVRMLHSSTAQAEVVHTPSVGSGYTAPLTAVAQATVAHTPSVGTGYTAPLTAVARVAVVPDFSVGQAVVGLIPATASAQMVITGKAKYGSKFAARGVAQSLVDYTVLIRSPQASASQAKLTVGGVVFPRREFGGVSSVLATASSGAKPRVQSRGVTQVSTSANLQVDPHIGSGVTSPTGVLCRAYTAVNPTYWLGVTTPTGSTARAMVALTPTVITSVEVLSSVTARAVTQVAFDVYTLWSGPIYAIPRALATPTPAVGRGYIAPVLVTPRALVTPTPAVGRGYRTSMLVTPRALLGVGYTVIKANPVPVVARAVIFAEFDVVKQIPWDEPAPFERVLKVNAAEFTFKVLS